MRQYHVFTGVEEVQAEDAKAAFEAWLKGLEGRLVIVEEQVPDPNADEGGVGLMGTHERSTFERMNGIIINEFNIPIWKESTA